jgi:hypothetical protein
MVYPVVGVALGSWIGAFPIALDWDRPWQVHQIHESLEELTLMDCASGVAFDSCVRRYPRIRCRSIWRRGC